MCNLKSKPGTHNRVPCWSKLFVHSVFDHFSCSLLEGGGGGGGAEVKYWKLVLSFHQLFSNTSKPLHMRGNLMILSDTISTGLTIVLTLLLSIFLICICLSVCDKQCRGCDIMVSTLGVEFT